MVKSATKKTTTKSAIKKTTFRDKPKKVINSLDISLEELLGAGCHFGHLVSKVNPKMQEYIFAVREGVHIFDLVKTKNQLEEAINFLAEIVASGGKIIFLGTKRQAAEAVKEAAIKMGMFYVNTRWIGGLLTNWPEVKKNLTRLEELKQRLAEKETSLTKYEISVLKREQRRLEDLYGGLIGLEELPQNLFIVDPKKERTAVREAKIMGIKVAGIADTNADPDDIDYIIPANDDAKASVEFIFSKITAGVKKAQK